jgi:hypothetical protein
MRRTKTGLGKDVPYKSKFHCTSTNGSDKLTATRSNRVRRLHDQDLKAGDGEVYLPYALERKYKNASREFGWQFVFPADAVDS